MSNLTQIRVENPVDVIALELDKAHAILDLLFCHASGVGGGLDCLASDTAGNALAAAMECVRTATAANETMMGKGSAVAHV